MISIFQNTLISNVSEIIASYRRLSRRQSIENWKRLVKGTIIQNLIEKQFVNSGSVDSRTSSSLLKFKSTLARDILMTPTKPMISLNEIVGLIKPVSSLLSEYASSKTGDSSPLLRHRSKSFQDLSINVEELLISIDTVKCKLQQTREKLQRIKSP